MKNRRIINVALAAVKKQPKCEMCEIVCLLYCMQWLIKMSKLLKVTLRIALKLKFIHKQPEKVKQLQFHHLIKTNFRILNAACQ